MPARGRGLTARPPTEDAVHGRRDRRGQHAYTHQDTDSVCGLRTTYSHTNTGRQHQCLFLHGERGFRQRRERATKLFCEEMVHGIVAALRSHLLVPVADGRSEVRGVRVLAGAMRWSEGDGIPTPPDPVRSRSLPETQHEPIRRPCPAPARHGRRRAYGSGHP